MNNTNPVDFFPPVTVDQVESFFLQAGELLDQAAARQQERDRVEATQFNLVRMIKPNENGLSDILADLLRPSGRHGQGDCFLRLFLEQLQPGLGDSLKSVRRIKRESRTFGIENDRRRIDVLIECEVLVGIENKIDAADQFGQVKDYLEHLRVYSKTKPAFLIYLTPNGRQPDSPSLPDQDREEHLAAGCLCLWSYANQVRTWLKSCIAVCEAGKVRHFLVDFIEYIDVDLRRAKAVEESEARSE